MAGRVCPPWAGYLLINPMRKIFDNPRRIFKELVKEGMVILEPGPAMGYFTLPLAKMVGPNGRVVAVDIQEKMLAGLRKRAEKSGLLQSIDIRYGKNRSMGIEDLYGKVDLVIAINVVHEIEHQRIFFEEVYASLKLGGRILIIEPRGHVSNREFESSMILAKEVGLYKDTDYKTLSQRKVIFIKK